MCRVEDGADAIKLTARWSSCHLTCQGRDRVPFLPLNLIQTFLAVLITPPLLLPTVEFHHPLPLFLTTVCDGRVRVGAGVCWIANFANEHTHTSVYII